MHYHTPISRDVLPWHKGYCIGYFYKCKNANTCMIYQQYIKPTMSKKVHNAAYLLRSIQNQLWRIFGEQGNRFRQGIKDIESIFTHSLPSYFCSRLLFFTPNFEKVISSADEKHGEQPTFSVKDSTTAYCKCQYLFKNIV